MRLVCVFTTDENEVTTVDEWKFVKETPRRIYVKNPKTKIIIPFLKKTDTGRHTDTKNGKHYFYGY